MKYDQEETWRVFLYSFQPFPWPIFRQGGQGTHNRLFDTLTDLKRSIRASLCYFQTVRQRIETLIAKCYPRPGNQTPLPGT